MPKRSVLLLELSFVLIVLLSTAKCREDDAQCKEDEWPCITLNQCIEKSLVCEGIPDCMDGSDETFNLCSRSQFNCRKDQFRCSYGACVPEHATCNAVEECIDGSDEFAPQCNLTGSPPPPYFMEVRPCQLPEYPKNGNFTSPSCRADSNCSSLIENETVVERGTEITYACEDGYPRQGPAKQSCVNGFWLPRADVKCSNFCDPLVSNSLDLACFGPESRKSVSCNEPQPHNAVAHFKCRSTHKKAKDIGYSKLTCLNGDWDKPFTDKFCVPLKKTATYDADARVFEE